MKKIFFLMVPFFLFAGIGAKVQTEFYQIAQVNIEHGEDKAYFFFAPKAKTWGAKSCPNAIYAIIDTDLPGAKEAFEAAVASQNSKTIKARFTGTCGDPTGKSDKYIMIEYTILRGAN